MKIKSVLKPKHVAWAIGALGAVIVVSLAVHSGAKTSTNAQPKPVVKVAVAEKKAEMCAGNDLRP
jgi:hypothetical protein